MATTTNTNTNAGQVLRARREAAGVTRAQLAGMVGCSLGSLANMEQGAVPRQSRVLAEAQAALGRMEQEGVSR